MHTVKISRRAFLTGLGLASTAALLSACNTVPASSHSGAAPSQPDSEAPVSSAASEVPAQPILSVDEFPITDGSTACIPLIAQIMADTTGMDLETAQSAVNTNTTAQAWRNLGLYGGNSGDAVKLIIAYEAPESVKEELKADGDPLEQKAIGRDALVFIVNEDNPVQSLTRQQLKDIYAGTITNWKDVGGADARIVVVSRDTSSGTYETWETMVMKGERVAPSALLQASNGAVVQAVSKNPNAIGYIGIGYLDKSTKGLQVNGKTATAATALSREWPLSRDLYIYTNGAPVGEVKGLVDYILDPQKGQKAVAEVGFVPLGK